MANVNTNLDFSSLNDLDFSYIGDMDFTVEFFNLDFTV